MTTFRKDRLALIVTLFLLNGLLIILYGVPMWFAFPEGALLGYALSEVWPLYQIVVNEE